MRRRTPPVAATVVDVRTTGVRAGEAVAAAIAGGALGALIGLPLAVLPVTAAIGAANGAVSGWRGVYAWRTRQGCVGFVLDSTWALATTFSGLVSHGVSALQSGRGGYNAALSVRQDRHVYARGMVLKKGFATTWGNVVTGAGDVVGDSTQAARRRQLITDHEDVHVWQSRVFGPIYPVVYVGWMVLGGIVGALRWLPRRDAPLGKYIESTAYYANPFEWWAYSRDAHWPPRQALAARVWKKPMNRPLSSLR